MTKRTAYHEPESKVRICGMAHPVTEAMMRFVVTMQDGEHITVSTTAEALMRRYGPATGATRWALADVAGGLW